MASDLKLAYVIATPEFPVGEGVTAYQGDLKTAFRKLKDLGYDGAELMTVNPDKVDQEKVRQLADKYSIEIPVFCTGEVYGQEKLGYMDPDPAVRKEAILRTKKIIDFASMFGALVNIGRLRGRFCAEVTQETSLAWMYDAFNEVSDYAAEKGVKMILEPVAFPVCNNINSTVDGIEVVKKVNKDSFRLMVDTFHMHIEDPSMEQAFKDAAPYMDHIHFTDSNRLAPGRGVLDFKKIVDMIKAVDYSGYISVEIFQHPGQDIVIEESIKLLKPML